MYQKNTLDNGQERIKAASEHYNKSTIGFLLKADLEGIALASGFGEIAAAVCVTIGIAQAAYHVGRAHETVGIWTKKSLVKVESGSLMPVG